MKLSFTILEFIFLSLSVVSIVFNILQYKDQKKIKEEKFTPIYNGLVGLFNDIKLKISAAYTILVAIYSFSSFLKLKNSSSIVESVGNLKGCPSNGGNSLGVIHITSLSTISTFAKNVPN